MQNNHKHNKALLIAKNQEKFKNHIFLIYLCQKWRFPI